MKIKAAATPVREDAPFSVVGYIRVSTTRQADRGLSLPEQRAELERYCQARGYELVQVFVDAGASGRSDKGRPEFNRMIVEACARPRRYDAVLVFNFSRFFRDPHECEVYRRKLARNGVEFLSATQDVGKGKEGDLVRSIVTIFDGYQSEVNAEQVKVVMAANARAGYWNGSKPPFGYTTRVATRIGDKEKKVLVVDEAEAAIVRRIFRIYHTGEHGGPPMGLKAICTKLNTEGVRIRNKPFMTSTVSDILKRETYVGVSYYNQKNSRTGEVRPRDEWIAVEVPSIVNRPEWDAVQARLAENHPRVTPPRTVTSPTLLAGIGCCGHKGCGAALILLTGKGGQYRYYTCQLKRTHSADACGLKPVSMSLVDTVVLDALERRLLAPACIEGLLAAFLERSDEAVAARRAELGRLKAERTRSEAALANIWQMIEAGHATPSDTDVAERLAIHRSRIKDLGEEIRLVENQDATPSKRVTPETIARFSAMIRELLRGPDHTMRQSLVRLLVEKVELSAAGVSLKGSKRALEHAVAAQKSSDGKVLTFERKWRAPPDKHNEYVSPFALP